MNHLQKHLLDNFKIIVKILEKQEIPYYLIGGTQLGAIRHQGFIPWDDDIDIAIPRPDYDRLAANFKDYFKEYTHLDFHTKETNSSYPYFFGKIYDKNTTLVEDYVKPLTAGIYIDVFPLDGINIKKSKEILKKNKILLRIYRYKKGLYNKNKHFILKSILAFLVKFYPMKLIEKKILKIRKSCNFYNSDYIAMFDGIYGDKELFHKSLYDETAEYIFEDIKVRSYLDSSLYLTQIFGDYMKLPPKDKQKSHHEYLFLDLRKPYSDYKIDIRKREKK